MPLAEARAEWVPGSQSLEEAKMRSLSRLGGLALMCLALGEGAALAQTASIAGVVRDTSGGVMPGVTVEASSPALIEKTRTAITDGDGQYKIIDLRPGTYTVTFSLAGFSTVKREGIELTGDFTAHDQRRPEGRRARGDDHRLRPEPADRYAERHPAQVADAAT